MIKTLFQLSQNAGVLAHAPAIALGLCLVAFACVVAIACAKPTSEIARTGELPLHDE
ncbi:MAG: hypothetical protein IOD12_14360 [Silvanigrellales bacterium]|jgi:F0F1-type ATP synthase membrane subunit c/vacuolar-type H+-ATPase subunit K|nr:hypothetical protein [Silvanigrellales bacterium]